jgi:hypothetical protein
VFSKDRYAAYLIKARKKPLHLKAGYIDADFPSFEAFPLHSHGGPYIRQKRLKGWVAVCRAQLF